jgi:hypothetical protein
VVLSLLAADRHPEVPQSAAERATDFGKPLRPEDQQRDHQDEQKMRGLEDVPNHV